MRVLVTDAVADEGLAYLREHGLEVDTLLKPPLPTLYERLPEYDALITRSGTAVTAELLDHAPRLRFVGRAGVGVDNGQPRIVRMRDLKIEFTPEGYILVLAYEDRPGVVGSIGTLLGRRNVNIAAMHVGRRVKRGRAIVVLILDEDLTPDQLAEVTGAIGADFARLIRLP